MLVERSEVHHVEIAIVVNIWNKHVNHYITYIYLSRLKVFRGGGEMLEDRKFDFQVDEFFFPWKRELLHIST